VTEFPHKIFPGDIVVINENWHSGVTLWFDALITNSSDFSESTILYPGAIALVIAHIAHLRKDGTFVYELMIMTQTSKIGWVNAGKMSVVK